MGATTGESGSPAGGEAVAVTTDRTAYRVGDLIHAVIRNMGPEDLFAATGGTYCTVVTAERSSGQSWHPVAPCAQGAPPGLVRIAAGTTLPLDLPPPGAPSDPLPAGTYRLRCAFALGSTDGPSGEARSAVFTIRM